jgi:precorrin-8X/cobalt-precorrin-8 methylmutase
VPRARQAHPIEVESYRILRSRVSTDHLPPLTKAVVERVVHTTADPTWVGDLVTTEDALARGRAALLGGAPVIADVRMVAAAVTSLDCVVGLDLPGVADLATDQGMTRSAAGIRRAARRFADGAVWVVGNAPTALTELIDLVVTGTVRPALVVGLPVGFVGSVVAKSTLRTVDVPSVSGVTERGGAAVAAAVVNALLYFEEDAA